MSEISLDFVLQKQVKHMSIGVANITQKNEIAPVQGEYLAF